MGATLQNKDPHNFIESIMIIKVFPCLFCSRTHLTDDPLQIACKRSCLQFNPLPNDKILDLFKLKAFAEIKFTVTQKMKFPFYKVENIVAKGENAGYQHFLLFTHCFQKVSSLGSLKFWIVW